MTQRLALFGGPRAVDPSPRLSSLCEQVPLAQRFADYVGVRHAVPMANGTAAIMCALIGAGVEPGDEVLTVSHTWFSTVTAVLAINAIPVFVDVDPVTFTMDPARVEEKITSRTRCILAVSLYGHPAAYDLLVPMARRHGLTVVDDACQSTGAALHGRRLGAHADITAFSFSGKPIVSTGGGMVTTDHQQMYERSMLLGSHPSYLSTHLTDPELHRLAATGGYGMNLRLDAQCAVRAYEQLERLDVINQARRANAQKLNMLLAGVSGLIVPAERSGAHHVYHMWTMILDEEMTGLTRREFLDALVAEGVPAIAYTSGVNFLKHVDGSPWEAGPVHARPMFQMLRKTGRCGPYRFPDGVRPDYRLGTLPITERLERTEVNIPQRWINPPFADERMERYAEAICKVLANADEIRERCRSERPYAAPHNFLLCHESDA